MPARQNSIIWLIIATLLGIMGCMTSSSSKSPSTYTEPEPAYIEPSDEIPSTNNDQLPAEEPLRPPGIPTSADVFEQSDVPIRSGESLDDVFQKIQNEIPFTLSAPQSTPGFNLWQVQIVKQFGYTSVVAFFASQQVAGQYIYFVQGEALQRIKSCEDLVLPPPPSNTPPEPTPPPVDCSLYDLDLGSVPARLLYIRNPMRNVLETHLIWDQNGVEFELGGDNIEGQPLVDIASSVEIVP